MNRENCTQSSNLYDIPQFKDWAAYLTHKISLTSTNLDDDSQSSYTDSSPAMKQTTTKDNVCSSLIAPVFYKGVDTLSLLNYCLCDINIPFNSTTNLNGSGLSAIYYNNVTDISSGFGNYVQNVVHKPVPIINEANKVLTDFNRVASWVNSCVTPSNLSQHIESKSVYAPSDMGESRPTEKDTYVKAVFHITRIDRKTKRKQRVNKHRHVISHWEHVGAQYYARGMCKKCYFAKGKRKKNASKCQHTERSHYAIGLCKLWYLKRYHKLHDRKKPDI